MKKIENGKARFLSEEKVKLRHTMEFLTNFYSGVYFIDEEEALFYLRMLRQNNKAIYLYVCFLLLSELNCSRNVNILKLAQKSNLSIISIFTAEVKLKVEVQSCNFLDQISPSLKVYSLLRPYKFPLSFIFCLKSILESIENFYFDYFKVKSFSSCLINIYIQILAKFCNQNLRKKIFQKLKLMKLGKKVFLKYILYSPVHYYALKYKLNYNFQEENSDLKIKDIINEFGPLNKFKKYDQNIHDFNNSLKILSKEYLIFKNNQKSSNCKCWECKNKNETKNYLVKIIEKNFYFENEFILKISQIIIDKYLNLVYHGDLVTKKIKKGLLAFLFYKICIKTINENYLVFSPLNICVMFKINMKDFFVGELIAIDGVKTEWIVNVSPSVMCEYVLDLATFPRFFNQIVKKILYFCEKFFYKCYTSEEMLWSYTNKIIDFCDYYPLNIYYLGFFLPVKLGKLKTSLNIEENRNIIHLNAVISYFCHSCAMLMKKNHQ